MSTAPILFAPNDYPQVEVIVDGVWCEGELTMWSRREDRDPPGW